MEGLFLPLCHGCHDWLLCSIRNVNNKTTPKEALKQIKKKVMEL